VWDGDILRAVYQRGNSIGRFTTKGDNPKPARSVGMVLRKKLGACTIRIDANKSFVFTPGIHQDYIVGSGKNWVIKDNIIHDGVGQGIFTTAGIFTDCVVEQNLIYDLYGTTLTNVTLGGNSVFRYNTILGYLRPYTNHSTQYSPTSSNFFAGNASFSIDDPCSDAIYVYSNIVGGSLNFPTYESIPLCAYWDYNIVQAGTTTMWGTEPWPCNSAKISSSSSNANMRDNFFLEPDYTHANGKFLDYRLKPKGSKWPSPLDFGCPEMPVPAKSLGTLDDANEFVLDNGVVRDPTHSSAGVYEYGQ
jgi:hypothetical protein